MLGKLNLHVSTSFINRSGGPGGPQAAPQNKRLQQTQAQVDEVSWFFQTVKLPKTASW